MSEEHYPWSRGVCIVSHVRWHRIEDIFAFIAHSQRMIDGRSVCEAHVFVTKATAQLKNAHDIKSGYSKANVPYD